MTGAPSSYAWATTSSDRFSIEAKGDSMTRFHSSSILRIPALAGLCATWLALAPAPLAAASGEGCVGDGATTIKVTVEKVRSSKGLITAVLYDDNPKTFLKNGARLDRIRVEASAGETELCLNAPAAGRSYSVALYHDENGNTEFDTDFLGIPTEGYGFSQNPGFRFGKPDVEETLFNIAEDQVALRISLLYLNGQKASK
jgi:uncharacterized protein (DUF2141 family)